MQKPTGLSYKKSDKLIYGAVKNLTCILPQKFEDYHEEQHYAVFWVSHINKVHVSMPLTSDVIKENFKIDQEAFNNKIRKDDTICEKCKKKDDSAFYDLVRYGEKLCRFCFRENERTKS